MSAKPAAPFVARPQVEATHYRPSSYLTPKRMASIGYQLQLVATHFPAASVLEIGGGGGLARQLLREEGHEVLPIDLDPALRPDVVAALPDLPLRGDAVDCVLCCQVLEHMPWEASRAALREMYRVARKGAVISVPSVQRGVALVAFGPVRDGSRAIELPALGASRIRNRREHHWELGAGVSLAQFRAAIAEAGFAVAESFRPVTWMYHHFFVLKKS